MAGCSKRDSAAVEHFHKLRNQPRAGNVALDSALGFAVFLGYILCCTAASEGCQSLLLCLVRKCALGRQKLGALTEVRVRHDELCTVFVHVFYNAGNRRKSGSAAGFNAVVSGDYAILSVSGRGHDYPRQKSIFPDRFHQFVHFEVAVHLERLIFPWNKQVYRDFFFVILDCRFIAEEVVHIQLSGIVGSSEIEPH